jgi:protein TonB
MNEPQGFSGFLVIALLLWLVLLLSLGQTLLPTPAPPVEPTMDAQLVELSPPPPSAMKTPPAKAVAMQHPLTTSKPIIQQKLPPPVAPPLLASPNPTPTKLAPAPIPAPVKTAVTPSTNQSGTEQLGAYAVYQPKPVIPEDLQDIATHVVVSARFHIAADGTVRVKLLHAAPDPRLNQVILNTLNSWRFMPATQNGKPVETDQDIEVTVDVGG